MSLLWDNHMHSSFSGDCDIPAKEMAAAAKEKGLLGITFTDHLDLDYMYTTKYFLQIILILSLALPMSSMDWILIIRSIFPPEMNILLF